MAVNSQIVFSRMVHKRSFLPKMITGTTTMISMVNLIILIMLMLMIVTMFIHLVTIIVILKFISLHQIKKLHFKSVSLLSLLLIPNFQPPLILPSDAYCYIFTASFCDILHDFFCQLSLLI